MRRNGFGLGISTVVMACVLGLLMLAFAPTICVDGKKASGARTATDDEEASVTGVLLDGVGIACGQGRFTLQETTKDQKVRGKITLTVDGAEETWFIEADKIATVRMPVAGPFNGIWAGQAANKVDGTVSHVTISGSISWEQEVSGYSAVLEWTNGRGVNTRVVFEAA